MTAHHSEANHSVISREESSECRLCRNRAGNRFHVVREMMFGTKDNFTYLECGGCGCLQLLDTQVDPQKYYPSTYYSFSPKASRPTLKKSFRASLSRLRNLLYFSRLSMVKAGVRKLTSGSPLRAVAAARPERNARILDVGCGDGTMLRVLAQVGFTHLFGIDPFANYGKDTRLPAMRKCSIEDLPGTTWDLIMFHHSFEHVFDPLGTLRTVAGLLSDSGSCLIRMPVVAWPWHAYGVDWAEIDAPRHYFVHSEKSLRLIAEEAGLRVRWVEFDSTEFQFWGSELYKRGIPLSSLTRQDDPSDLFSARELKSFRTRAKALNKSKLGGRAAFLLTR